MSYDNNGEERRGLSQTERATLEWQRQLANKEQPSISQRRYYKDLDFTNIKVSYNRLTTYYNALERLMEVEADTPEEFVQLVKMRFITFKKMQTTIDNLIFEWVEATASFSGSSQARQEAYESIIDEIKAAVSACTPATDEDQLRDFLKVSNHLVLWLLSESLNYSLGERVDSTDPQRYGLEHEQVRVASGVDAMQQGQIISQNQLSKGKGIAFQKKGTTQPPKAQKSSEG